MTDFCTCADWNSVKNRDLFKWHEQYGWIIHWIELTKEKGYTQRHQYGLSIAFCPMCGKKLTECEDT